MKSIRLLPVVILAVAALLVLKTVGLVTNGGYVLTGASTALAQEHGAAGDATFTPPVEPTLTDTSPTLSDGAPTLGEDAAGAQAAPAEGGGHGDAAAEPADGETAAPEAAEAGHGTAVPAEGELAARDAACGVLPAEAGGASFAADAALPECDPLAEQVPMEIDSSGRVVPLTADDGSSLTEQALLQRLAARRGELEAYEQQLALRASIMDAAEKRIEERAATMEALEAQIATLVDQRQQMESGQFAGIVAMYETMKPKDAARIFDALDMDVLLRVAKTMSPRRMAPIMAEMTATRAQELTVRMAALADLPAAEMTQDDLAALPQIVGQ